MSTALEGEAANTLNAPGVKGMMCTGENGLLLTSVGNAPSNRAGFMSSMVTKAGSLHCENPPIVTIETISK